MQVAIIGAGVAGLAAAQVLSAAGVKVCILEAKNRIGGRIHTVRDPRFALPFEFGAEFIHGRPDEIFSITEAAHLAAPEVLGPHRYASDGKLSEPEELFSRVDQIFARMGDPSLPDQSFADFLEWVDGDPEAVSLARAYVEGFNAARAERISIHALAAEIRAGEAIDGDRSFRVEAGYDRVAEWLWTECRLSVTSLHLERVATTVHWARGNVEIAAQTPSGKLAQPFFADCAVITLPLGVLQSPQDAPGAVRFLPALTEVGAALDRLEMGQAMRITVAFRPSFWEAQPQLGRPGFIHSRERWFPTWWTALSPSVPALTGWAGGPKAEALRELDDASQGERAIDSLAAILGLTGHAIQDQVEAYFLHNWSGDPFARGAYSYAGVGGAEARRVLATPVEDTLFFAGEATNTEGYASTVHGAIATGKRAAQAIIQRIR
jgi:monoamine oxidase